MYVKVTHPNEPNTLFEVDQVRWYGADTHSGNQTSEGFSWADTLESQLGGARPARVMCYGAFEPYTEQAHPQNEAEAAALLAGTPGPVTEHTFYKFAAWDDEGGVWAVVTDLDGDIFIMSDAGKTIDRAG